MGTLVGSPRGLSKLEADFTHPNAHLFEIIEPIQEESLSDSSREGIEEEDKHGEYNQYDEEGRPGIYDKDSLGSYDSEEAKEREEMEPDDEMDFEDDHLRHRNANYGFGSDNDDDDQQSETSRPLT